MARRRTRWTEIPGTRVLHAHECVERDGITILCARLAGVAENNADGVSRVRDGLDALASSLAAAPEVATLDVTAFCNASDDACGILTGVFMGVPCCWITSAWDQQHDGQRWDLPESERMAPTLALAIARVVSWRRAGGFSVAYGNGRAREWRWSERGLVVRDTRDGALELADLYYRNKLVERTLREDPLERVLMPFPDRTGVAHESLRCGARLVLRGEEVREADFGPWSTERPLSDDWVAAIEGFVSLTDLDLRRTAAREQDILRAVQRLPALRALAIDPTALSPEARELLRRERPSLKLR